MMIVFHDFTASLTFSFIHIFYVIICEEILQSLNHLFMELKVFEVIGSNITKILNRLLWDFFIS